MVGDRSSAYYDAISGGYDSLYGDEQRAKYFFVKDWLSSLYGVSLDVGSGTGLIGEFFKPSVLCDYSFDMIVKASGARVVCDARFLPFKSKCFDCLTCFTVLQDVFDKGLVLSEVRRVCKDLVVLTALKRLHERGDFEVLFKGFDVLDYREEVKDHCFLLRVKEPSKGKMFRIPVPVKVNVNY